MEVKESWDLLSEYITNNNVAQIMGFLKKTYPAETARVIAHLDEESRQKLLVLLDPQNAADVLHDIPDEQAADLIEHISAEDAATIIDRMPIDEQVDILSDLKTEEAEAILDEMSPDEASKTRQILQYPADTAGGIMTLEYLAYDEAKNCGEISAICLYSFFLKTTSGRTENA